MKKFLLIGGVGVAAYFLFFRKNQRAPVSRGDSSITQANETDGGSGAKDIIRAGSNAANSAVDLWNAISGD
jgi:hypothetical protein